MLVVAERLRRRRALALGSTACALPAVEGPTAAGGVTNVDGHPPNTTPAAAGVVSIWSSSVGLRTIGLSNNPITDAGVGAVQALLMLSGLRLFRCFLHHTGLSAAGLEAVLACAAAVTGGRSNAVFGAQNDCSVAAYADLSARFKFLRH